MFLRFDAAVRVFVFAVAISFASTPVSADGQTIGLNNAKLKDETKIATCAVNDVNGKDEHILDFEFEGFSNHGGHKLSRYGRSLYCFYPNQTDDNKPENQDQLDWKVERTGKVKTVNELDLLNNHINRDNITEFLSDFDHTFMDRKRSKKGPDYLIMDNFVQSFVELDKGHLMKARNEAEEVSKIVCAEPEPSEVVRCDVLMWLKALNIPGESLPAFRQIAGSMAAFRSFFN